MANFNHERSVVTMGYASVCGVDEVGRGCLAGPLVAGAVVFDIVDSEWITRVNDSKKLSPTIRLELSELIKINAKDWALGLVNAQELDQVGLTKATELAMKQAIDSLNHVPDYLLLDYVPISSWNQPYQLIKQGDSSSYSIAAASIIAKVHRDEIMTAIDELYPQYDFASNKGYGTKLHMEALSIHGPCDIHRRSFSPVQRAGNK